MIDPEDEAQRAHGWRKGVETCIDIVKKRRAHYELYRCTCNQANGKQPHRPDCKGHNMSTHPATFAVLDEVLTFLQVKLDRGP